MSCNCIACWYLRSRVKGKSRQIMKILQNKIMMIRWIQATSNLIRNLMKNKMERGLFPTCLDPSLRKMTQNLRFLWRRRAPSQSPLRWMKMKTWIQMMKYLTDDFIYIRHPCIFQTVYVFHLLNLFRQRQLSRIWIIVINWMTEINL